MFKQKRAELLRASILIALLVLTIGIIFVYSANVSSSPQVSSPNVTKASINATLNFTITVSANGDTVQRVDINKPASYSVFNCPVLIPAGWTCDKTSATVISYTDAVTGITAGNSAQFGVNATSGAASGNVTWTINTFENTGGTVDQNNTLANTTIDGEGPLVSALNLTSGSLVLLLQNLTNATFVAKNDLVINVTVISNFSVVGLDKVAIYLNVTNETTFAARGYAPHPDNAFSYKTVVQMSNTTLVNPSAGRFNGTISSTLLYNGSIVTFVIVSNDTIGNQNITNGSVLVQTFTSGFNVTVDDAPPLATFPSGKVINDLFDAAADNITTSTQSHNFTVNVVDDGGSGVYSVWINVSNTLRNMTDAAGNSWNISDTLQGLGLSAGDQNVTVYFLVNDSVGNINTSFGFNLLVDDPDFAAIVTSNTTNNFTTSNRTIINITATLNINLNITVGSNVTIHGPNAFRFNMTRQSVTTRWGGVGTVAGQQVFQSTWFSSTNTQTGNAYNGTFSNLSDLGCYEKGIGNNAGTDGVACQLQISWNDLFGRANSTNITITVDTVAPRIINITVQNASDMNGADVTGSGRTLIVKSTDFLNFTVNSENSIANVTIHNASTGQLTNATLMGSGGDRNFSIQVQVTAAGTGSGLCRSEGLCTINFTATDQAFNINRTNPASVNVIVDDTPPHVGNNTVGDITAAASRGFSISNVTGSNTGSGDGTSGAFPGSAAKWTVRRTAIFNLTVNVTDTHSNVTLVSASNSSTMNFTKFPATGFTGAISVFQGIANASGLCGLGANVEVECRLAFTAKDNASNTNSSVNLTLRVDDLAPRVYNFSTKLALNHIANSLSTVIFFEANITDANLRDLNVSLYAVNSTANTGYNLLVMNKSQASNSNSTSVEWNASYTLTELGCDNPSGNCTIVLNATDVMLNQNNTVNISVQATAAIPNVTGISLSATRLNNVTKLTITALAQDDAKVANASFYIDAASNGIVGMGTSDGVFDEVTETINYTLNFNNYGAGVANGPHVLYIEVNDSAGQKSLQSTTSFTIDNSITTILNVSPTGALLTNNSISLWANTSTNANCRYNVTSQSYNSMGSTSDLGGASTTTHNSTLFAAIGQVFDGSYTYYFQCRGDGGSGDDDVSTSITFSVNTGAAPPNVTGISLSATRLNNVTKLTFTAAVDDDNQVRNATFYIDAASNGIVGMSPADGTFDEASEDVTYTLNFQNYALTEGVHRLYIEVNDTNSNKGSNSHTFTINNSVAAILNISPTGTLTTNNSISLSVNTSTAATCRYNVTSSSYDVMGSVSNLGSTSTTAHNSTLFSLIGEVFDGPYETYTYYVACRGDGGDGDSDVSKSVQFKVDTRANFNITMGDTGVDLGKSSSPATIGQDIFTACVGGTRNCWRGPLNLPRWKLETTALPTNYNVTNVLASVGGDSASGSYSKFLAYNGSHWTSYISGTSGNTFLNFTLNTSVSGSYYINITAKDRLEIN